MIFILLKAALKYLGPIVRKEISEILTHRGHVEG